MSLPFRPDKVSDSSPRQFVGRGFFSYKNPSSRASVVSPGVENGFKSRRPYIQRLSNMVDLEITYCQPCGHQPRAMEMVSQLLATYGMPLNRKLTVSLKPADKGVFDVVLDGQLIFSKHQQGRFPTMDDLKEQLDQKLTIPLETPQ